MEFRCALVRAPIFISQRITAGARGLFDRKAPLNPYLNAADIDHGARNQLVVFVGHEIPNWVEMANTGLAHGARYRYLAGESGIFYCEKKMGDNVDRCNLAPPTKTCC